MTSSQGHRAAVLARRPRFPPEVVARAVALHRLEGLTLRETRAAMTARGVDVSVESLRAWVRTTPAAASPTARAPAATWTPEATVAFVNGQPVHLWLARNSDGAVLEVLVQRSRDRRLALRDLRRLVGGVATRARSAEGAG